MNILVVLYYVVGAYIILLSVRVFIFQHKSIFFYFKTVVRKLLYIIIVTLTQPISKSRV